MKFRHIPSLLASNFVAASCCFENSSNKYDYKCADANVQVGDKYIVVTNRGLQIVTVKEVAGPESLNYDADYDFKWLAQKVDLTWHDNIMTQEAELVKELHRAERSKHIQEFVDNLKVSHPELEAVIKEHQLAITRL